LFRQAGGQGESLTPCAAVLLLREVDHRLALTADLAAELTDPRDPDRIRYSQVERLRRHLYAPAPGHAHHVACPSSPVRLL
jgi:hypothetical protein